MLMMNWYARQLTNHPLLIVLGVLVVTLVLTIAAILTQGLPTFKDPLLGFEPRGTELSQRSTAWHLLLEDSERKGSLSMHPSIRDEPVSADLVSNRIDNDSSRTSVFPSHSSDAWIILEAEKDELRDLLDGHIIMRGERKDATRRKKWQSGANSNFFCDDPGRDKVRVVFKSSTETSDLFTLRSLRSICQTDESKLRTGIHFTDLCIHDPNHKCCRSWSIPSYVALLSNRSYCGDITEEDVTYAKRLLSSCAGFYHDLKLSHDCTSDPVLCRDVPHECTRYNAVYNILHYLADSKFLGADTRSSKLTYTTVFLPVHLGVDSLDYFYDLQQLRLSDGITEVFGMEFGLKHALLKRGLVHDVRFTITALVIVFFCLWTFTTSFLLTFMTALAVMSSLATSYFVYSVIYKISYFPVMNALSAIVLIGISSTDAFIYNKIWWTVKAEKSSGITSRQVRDAMQLSFPSMLANTVTIAAALYSNVCSSVTIVRCFSIFTGTAVLINFLLNLAWLPASIVITDRWCTSSCCLCIPPFGIYMPYFQKFKCCSYSCSLLWRFHYLFADASRVFFEKILPCLIIKPRWFWLTLLSATTIGSTVVIFYEPSLMPPNSKEMQVFGSDHPFEKYDLLVKKYFWYEKASDHQTYHNLPIRMVWGVLPIDNGRYVDPMDRGNLVLDPQFHMSSRSSQEWLLAFCKELRNQTFYKVNPNRHESNCFIETFKYWMERRCVDGYTHQNRTPCCEISKFPYSQDVFNICIREAIAIFHRSQSYFVAPGVAGPRFSKETGDVRVIVVEYGSTVSSTGSYEEIKQFANSVNSWMDSMLKSAPPEMKNGWFVSDLDFYDLQAYLSCGIMATIGVALGAISLSLLITTMNLVVAFCLILTVTSIILVSLASLVLLGWRLHAVETLLVTVMTAMATDLAIRYGIAYHNSPQEDKESSLVFTIARLSSSIAMASITNFLAGLALMPTAIMTFLQIGIFLMILNTTSWIYSTFFLHSLLSLLSPGRTCISHASPQQNDKLYALSESNLSTSSVSCPSQIQISTDHHQLEPLSVSKIASTQRPVSRRARSGSLSMFKCENPGWYGHPKRPSRKVSLPVVHISNPAEPSPRHVSGATSATTLVGGDDERDGATFCRKETESWPPIEILV